MQTSYWLSLTGPEKYVHLSFDFSGPQSPELIPGAEKNHEKVMRF